MFCLLSDLNLNNDVYNIIPTHHIRHNYEVYMINNIKSINISTL